MDGRLLDEKHFGEVDVVLLYIEEARQRAERAVRELRKSNAEDFMIEAVGRAQTQLSECAKLLTQGTFFAVPERQLRL